ncbi:hypothetical protein D3C72_2484670 [compost metagenome]
MPGKVECHHSEPAGDLRVIKQVPELARISAGSMQAKEDRSAAGFFEVDALIAA